MPGYHYWTGICTGKCSNWCGLTAVTAVSLSMCPVLRVRVTRFSHFRTNGLETQSNQKVLAILGCGDGAQIGDPLFTNQF